MEILTFLEKKPRIAYTLSWDGVTEGKVTNTYGNDIIFRQTYDVNEHAEWYAKYFSNTP